MYLDRVIVRTNRRSDGLYTIPDDKNPHSPIRRYELRPQGPVSRAVTWNPVRKHIGSMLRLSSWHLHWRHDLCEHSTAASRSRPISRQLTDVISFISIVSFVLVSGSNLIQLTISNLILLVVSDFIWLVVTDLILLAVFYWIWISFFIWFDSCLTYLFYIWATSFESHSNQDSGSPTLVRVYLKIQYLNCGIFHDDENSYWFGKNTQMFSKN